MEVWMGLALVRKDGTISYLGPDEKVQVSVEYENDKPVRVDTVVISTQHLPEATKVDRSASSIIRGLVLRKPIYRQTAAYGHFGGKDIQLPWEWTDKATVLRNELAKMEK